MASETTYVGVTRPAVRGERTWLAQNRKRRLWWRGFPTAAAAASWLASELGVPVRDLERKRRGVAAFRAVAAARSNFSGVSLRFRGGEVRYEAHVHARWVGQFTTESGAAAAAAEASGRSLGSLRRGALASKPRAGASRKRARDAFAAAHAVFKDYLPHDIAELPLVEKRWRAAIREETGGGGASAGAGPGLGPRGRARARG